MAPKKEGLLLKTWSLGTHGYWQLGQKLLPRFLIATRWMVARRCDSITPAPRSTRGIFPMTAAETRGERYGG